MKLASQVSCWPKTTIAKSSYLRGRIGWQGLRASEFTEEGPYLITGHNFRNGKVDWNSCYHVTEERYAEAEYIHVKNGDVLITKDGTVGKVVFVDDCPGRAVLNSGIFLLRCKDGSYDEQFIFHILRSGIFVKFLDDNLAGSTIQHLYQHVFEGFEFPIPPLEEQKTLAATLSTLDAAIEKSETLIAKLKQVRAGMLHDLLTCGVDENGELRDPVAHSEQFRDSEIGRFPRNWKILSLESLLAPVPNALRSGPFGSSLLKHELKTSGIPLLGIDNVYVERFVSQYSRFVSEEKFQELARYVVRPRDVMITIMGTVGRCCVVPDSIKTMLSSKHVWTVTLDAFRYSPDVACWQINFAPWVLRQLKRDEQGGVMTAIRSDTIRNLLFPVPEPHEMEVIQNALIKSRSLIAEEEAHLEKLQKLKAGLSADLLTGRVRVPPNLELS